MNKGSSILVTGGAGYIGTHVVDKLLQSGYKVKVYDQFIFGQGSLTDLKDNPKLEIITGKISETNKLERSLSGVAGVVHLAGLVGDPACALDEELTVEMNIRATAIVKNLAKKMRVPRLVFASSCSVYGASDKIVNELSSLHPISLYARTKVVSEKELLEEPDPNFHPTVLRFATVFGHSRRPRFDLVVNLFVAQAYLNGVITVTGSKQWRPFIHPADIAVVVLKVLEAPLAIVDRQIFNVGDQKLNMTIGELANLVARIVKRDKNNQPVRVLTNDDIDDKRNYKVAFDKIFNSLAFRASHRLEDGVKEVYENFQKGLYQDCLENPIYSNYKMAKAFNLE